MTKSAANMALAKRLFFGDKRDDLAHAIRAMRASATPENKLLIRQACADVLVSWTRYELMQTEKLHAAVSGKAWVN